MCLKNVRISFDDYYEEFDGYFSGLCVDHEDIYNALCIKWEKGIKNIGIGEIDRILENSFDKSLNTSEILKCLRYMQKKIIGYSNEKLVKWYGEKTVYSEFPLLRIRLNFEEADRLSKKENVMILDGRYVELFIEVISLPLRDIAIERISFLKRQLNILKKENNATKKLDYKYILNVALILIIDTIPYINKTIVYDDLFSYFYLIEKDNEGNYDNPQYVASQKSKYKNYVCKLLDNFVEKKIIKSYEVQKDGNMAYGVQINKYY